MKAVTDPPKPLAPINYAEICKAYNNISVGEAIELDMVYNITLFKRYLANHGNAVNDVDFQAYSVSNHTYLKRLTEKQMEIKSDSQG